MRLVARESGTSLATIAHHCGGKAGLYRECLALGYEDLAGLPSRLAEELSRPGLRGLEARVGAVARAAYRYTRERYTISRFLVRAALYDEGAPGREVIERAHESFLESATRAVSGLLERDPAELRIPLQTFLFTLTRMAIMTDSERAASRATDDALADHLAELAVCALVRSARGKTETNDATND